MASPSSTAASGPAPSSWSCTVGRAPTTTTSSPSTTGLPPAASATAAYRRQFEEEFARRMAAPDVVAEREALRASGLRERDPEAYRKRAFELSVAGYFRDFRDARRLTPFRVTARTQDLVWASLGEYDIRPRLREVSSRVVHGTYDPVPIQGSREVAEILGADFIELPVGHCPHVEATEQFVEALDGFLPRA